MSNEDLPVRELELNIRLTNVIERWKPGATLGDVRQAMADPHATLGGYLRSRDRKEIRELLFNIPETAEAVSDEIVDPATIVRNLLEHAVYDREKSDECIAAVEAAEQYLASLA